MRRLGDPGYGRERPAPSERQGLALTETTGQQPVLRIVRGDATPEEIAALVAVIASMSGGQAPSKRRGRAAPWADPGRRSRTPLAHGPGAWRSSGLPR